MLVSLKARRITSARARVIAQAEFDAAEIDLRSGCFCEMAHLQLVRGKSLLKGNGHTHARQRSFSIVTSLLDRGYIHRSVTEFSNLARLWTNELRR
jgi:hypothetical protein